MLTGCRKNEILTLRWEHVDLDRSCLRLPDSKTGAKVVPLGASAKVMLASLARREGNPFVCWGDRSTGHLVGLFRAWDRIRTAAGLPDLRIHDLRHYPACQIIPPAGVTCAAKAVGTWFGQVLGAA